MRTIRTLLLATLVAGTLLAVGCQGADVAGQSAAQAGQPPEETVTEHSALCVDNLSGNYTATWNDSSGRGPTSMDMRLSTYIRSCSFYVPQGQVVGGMSWFSPGPHNTVIGAFGSNPAWWNGSRTVFYANDPVSSIWWRWTCVTTGTYPNGWNCLFDEWTGSSWISAGTFTLRGY